MARPRCDTPLVSFFNCAKPAWMKAMVEGSYVIENMENF